MGEEEVTAWLPPELMPYSKARVLLGLLLFPSEQVTPHNYPDHYWAKLADLWEEDPADGQVAVENLAPEGWPDWLGPVNGETAAYLLMEQDGVHQPAYQMSMYLRGDSTLQELREELDLGEPEKPPSPEEFRQELEELSLRALLEMVC